MTSPAIIPGRVRHHYKKPDAETSRAMAVYTPVRPQVGRHGVKTLYTPPGQSWPIAEGYRMVRARVFACGGVRRALLEWRWGK